MLLVGVGREGAATACPVLERGGGGLAGERAHVGVQAAADLARVDDDDLTRAACLGVAVQVDLDQLSSNAALCAMYGYFFMSLSSCFCSSLFSRKGFLPSMSFQVMWWIFDSGTSSPR